MARLAGALWEVVEGGLMAFVFTLPQRHEVTAAEQLLDQGGVKRASRGRPRADPNGWWVTGGIAVAGFACFLRRWGTRVTIPRKRNERHAAVLFPRPIANATDCPYSRVPLYRLVVISPYDPHLAEEQNPGWLQ